MTESDEAPAPCVLHLSRINFVVLGVLGVFGFLYYVSVFCVVRSDEWEGGGGCQGRARDTVGEQRRGFRLGPRRLP